MAEPNGNVVGTGYDQTLKRVLTRKDYLWYRVYDADRAGLYLRLCDDDDRGYLGVRVRHCDGRDAFHRDELR